MATEVKMPQLSDTMHTGKILSWKKKEGDKISRGDILAEVETEKANLEIESFNQGVLLKILVPAQTMVNVGDAIAVIGEAGEQVAAPAMKAASPAAASPQPSAPTARAPGSPSRSPASQVAPISTQQFSSGDRLKVSPLARKIAEQKNIDLNALRGSGPEGRIVRKDVEQAQPLHLASRPAQRPSIQPVTAQVARSIPEQSAPGQAMASGGRTYPLSKMREVIARRMQESVTQSPHFFTTVRINMGEAKRLCAALKEKEEFKGIGLNHLIIKAAGYALKHERRVNFAIRDGMVYEPDGINIGIITAIEDGLLIPVIKDADSLPLPDLAFEARAAVERARAGRPSSSDLSGGTFSISNMGMFDVENFTAIINPGQGAVLAVSSVKEEPIVQNGQVIIGQMMRVTLSVDHRIIDGIMAANFLKAFKEGLEIPALLMM